MIGRDGKPYKVVKFATDITQQKAEDADRAGQIAAIGKAQAVIAFDLDGNILDANANFLAAVGYDLREMHRPPPQHVRRAGQPAERGLQGVLGGAEERRVSGRPVQAHRQGRARGLDPGDLQPDPRRGGPALQGREVRHRHHRTGPAAGQSAHADRTQLRRDRPGVTHSTDASARPSPARTRPRATWR